MGIKKKIEDHAVLFFLATVIVGFAAGWGAHVAVQTTSGLIPVPMDKASQIDRCEGALSDSRVENTRVEAERDRLKQQVAAISGRPDDSARVILLEAERDRLKQQLLTETTRSDYPAKVLALEAERDQLRKTILANRSAQGNLITNIVLRPASPAVLKVGELVVAEFDYEIPKGMKAGVYASQANDHDDIRCRFGGSNPLAGTGRIKRSITCTSAGRLTKLQLWISSDTEDLYRMEVPVDYVFH